MGDNGSGAVSVALEADDLVRAIEGLVRPKVAAEAFRRVASSQLTLDDLVELAGLIDRRLAEGYTGVVVTQGTDTIEETAFALDLLVAAQRPVVVTGSMRSATHPGSDGAANLLAAIETADAPDARGLGTLVVMNDEIHAARFVRKRHTSSPAAFGSFVGPIGWVSEGRPRIATRPPARLRLPGRPVLGARARVPLVSITLDDDGEILAALRAERIDALVLEALGGGHVPAPLVEPLVRLAAAVPVVLASRAAWGEVMSSTYEFSGSERELLENGLTSSGWLDSRKARVLLLLLVRCGLSGRALAAAFTEVVAGALRLPER